MPSPSASPSPPTVHTASTIRRLPPPSTLPVPRAPDGMVLDHELERRWTAVKARLSVVQNAILTNHPVRTEPRYWADIYTDVANLYNQNDAARKRRMYVYVRDFVKDLVAAQLAHLRKLDGPPLLAEYCRTWQVTMEFVRYMKRVLHHLHRFWIRDHANTLRTDPVRPLDKLLMFYWREELLSKLCNVITIAMKLVAADRRGDKIDHAIVRGVVDTLVTIGQADVPSPDSLSSKTLDPSAAKQTNLSLYVRLFEDEFLELTRLFYKKEGEKMVAVGDVTRFMKSVLARLAEEDERGRRLLHPDSAPRLKQATEEQLIGNHLTYLQEEAKDMIRAGREEDLKLVYTLLSRIENGLAPLRSFFVTYVRTEGNAVVVEHVDSMQGKNDMQSNLGLVRVLVRLHRKHSSLVRRCFDGSSVIMMAIDDAFRGFANRSLGNVSLPILIAHYVDRLLRSSVGFDREMWDATENINEKQSQANRDGGGGVRGCAVGGYEKSCGSKDQIEDGVNREGPSASEGKVKEGTHSKREDEDQLSRYIAELVRLFMYLDDKDLFFETHRRLFAKRLMTHHDEDLETRFITKVKTQMGPTYTQRLSGMLQDKLVSNSTRAKFAKYLQSKREQFKELKGKRNLSRRASQARCIPPMLALINPGQFTLTPKAGSHRAVPIEYVAEGKPSNDSGPLTNTMNSSTVVVNNVSLLAAAASIAAAKGDSAPIPSCESQAGKSDENQKDASREEGKDNFIIKGIVDMDALEEALRIDFNAHVLNALHWPAAKVADLRLPPVLKACQQMFSDFYMQNKETRKLSWIHNLSTVTMTAHFGGKRYTLVMSTFQASVLILFNERDSISVGEACKSLNINKDELVEHIMPLLLSRKCKLLKHERLEETEMEEVRANKSGCGDDEVTEAGGENRKSDSAVNSIQTGNGKRRRTEGSTEPVEERVTKRVRHETDSIEKNCNSNAGVDEVVAVGGTSAPSTKSTDEVRQGSSNKQHDLIIQSQDVLHLNTAFHSRMVRISVPTSIAKVENAEAVASKRNVVVDRSTQVDAALVRIMKSKREMTHAALSAEVISTLAPMFLPDPRLIKSRLERLIDQEYVERDQNDPRKYRYAA